jgi:hypothetical protein
VLQRAVESDVDAGSGEHANCEIGRARHRAFLRLLALRYRALEVLARAGCATSRAHDRLLELQSAAERSICRQLDAVSR